MLERGRGADDHSAGTALKFFTEEELRRSETNSSDLPLLVMIVVFHHDPTPLLEGLAAGIMPAANLVEGRFHLLIDCRNGEPDFRFLDSEALNAIFPAGGQATLRISLKCRENIKTQEKTK